MDALACGHNVTAEKRGAGVLTLLSKPVPSQPRTEAERKQPSDAGAAIHRAPLGVGPRTPGVADDRIVPPAGTDSPQRGRSAEDPRRPSCGAWRAVLRVGVAGILRRPFTLIRVER